MNQLIYTDENKLSRQISFNEAWAKEVNNAVNALKAVVGELSDEQIRLFLSSPSSLADELTSIARKEYDKYMAKAPVSVRMSSPFSDGGVPAAVNEIYKKLQLHKGYNLIDKTEILNGACVLSDDGKEALKEECSIYGDDKAAKVYELSCKAANALNELHQEIRGNNAFASAIECWGRWRGFVNISDDKYTPIFHNGNIGNVLFGIK